MIDDDGIDLSVVAVLQRILVVVFNNQPITIDTDSVQLNKRRVYPRHKMVANWGNITMVAGIPRRLY